MIFTHLSRNQLRYVLFRLKSAEIDGENLTQAAFYDLLAGWGIALSKSGARKAHAEIKNHFSAQLYFTGWENFTAEIPRKGEVLGTNKSWDIGMVDGDGSPASQARNIARMVNRPNKWFLFGAYYSDVIPTRGLSSSITKGLDHFERQGLAGEGKTVLRETRVYPDTSGRNREFDYHTLYEKGLTHGTYH